VAKKQPAQYWFRLFELLFNQDFNKISLLLRYFTKVFIKTDDFIHLVLSALTIVGWGVLFWALLVFADAKPEMSTILTRIHQIEVRQYWLVLEYERLMLLLWFCAGVSFVCLGVSWYLRSKMLDNAWLAQVLLLIVSSVAILVLTIWKPLMQ